MIKITLISKKIKVKRKLIINFQFNYCVNKMIHISLTVKHFMYHTTYSLHESKVFRFQVIIKIAFLCSRTKQKAPCTSLASETEMFLKHPSAEKTSIIYFLHIKFLLWVVDSHLSASFFFLLNNLFDTTYTLS